MSIQITKHKQSPHLLLVLLLGDLVRLVGRRIVGLRLLFGGLFGFALLALLGFLHLLRQMGVQIELGADLLPVGEAALLDARHMADQIRAVLGHVVAQRQRHLLGDEVDLRQDAEGDNVQLCVCVVRNGD